MANYAIRPARDTSVGCPKLERDGKAVFSEVKRAIVGLDVLEAGGNPP